MTNTEIHALDLEDMSQTAWTYIDYDCSNVVVRTKFHSHYTLHEKNLHEHMGHQ